MESIGNMRRTNGEPMMEPLNLLVEMLTMEFDLHVEVTWRFLDIV
jgi:hypothetical protein